MNNDDFFSQLKNLKNEILNDKENIENVCMITNEPLTEYYVTLSCNHKFNYKSLYNEVYYQKVKRPITEITILKVNQFKCPYCRKIQNNLLIPDLFPELNNVYGVNLPRKYCILPNKCCYKFLSGKNKGILCNKPCIKTYCKNHKNILENRELKKKEEKSNGDKNDYKYKQCCGIVKSGKNAGNQCVYKVKINDNNVGDKYYCKKHILK